MSKLYRSPADHSHWTRQTSDKQSEAVQSQNQGCFFLYCFLMLKYFSSSGQMWPFRTKRTVFRFSLLTCFSKFDDQASTSKNCRNCSTHGVPCARPFISLMAVNSVKFARTKSITWTSWTSQENKISKDMIRILSILRKASSLTFDGLWCSKKPSRIILAPSLKLPLQKLTSCTSYLMDRTF